MNRDTSGEKHSDRDTGTGTWTGKEWGKKRMGQEHRQGQRDRDRRTGREGIGQELGWGQTNKDWEDEQQKGQGHGGTETKRKRVTDTRM